VRANLATKTRRDQVGGQGSGQRNRTTGPLLPDQVHSDCELFTCKLALGVGVGKIPNLSQGVFR
jgi:hypothetical protein